MADFPRKNLNDREIKPHLGDGANQNSPNPNSLFHSGRLTGGAPNSAFNTPNPGNKIVDEFHSLQNSPFYNHYPMGQQQHHNGNDPLHFQRRPPQRELFPNMPNVWGNPSASRNGQSSPLFSANDRVYYTNIARAHGFIVGAELDHIKENSSRAAHHSYCRISAHFRTRYGETEAKTKTSYLQIGVRVPSKDHVSEIVGKGGQKIKAIREETGALITTPGEHEEHVFVIEAPPEIALDVGKMIADRAQEISQSKANASERRRGSTNSIPGCVPLFNGNGMSSGAAAVAPATLGAAGQRLLSRQSPDDLTTSIPSPSPLLKSSIGNGTNSTDGVFFSNCGSNNNNNGSTGGRILLARSKISVPQDMVGKIIGTQGSIITTIQKDTGTEIKSPPKEAARGPSATSEFEISAYQSQGLTIQEAENRVLQAKQLIAHLVMRQFERRSDEYEVGSANSGKSRNNSNGEDSDGNNNNNTNGNGANVNSKLNCGGATWMWNDVPQLDQKLVNDVLDRILSESKNKTRRVKELQAAAASSTGSLPASPLGLVSGGNNFNSEFFPSEKSAGSCQNSPFHQSRIPSHSNVFNTNNTTPGSLNLLSGYDRRLANVDFHSESEFPDNQQPQQGGGMCSNSSLLWSNSGPRHSFSSSGHLMGDHTSPALLRRHTMASAEPHHVGGSGSRGNNHHLLNEVTALERHSAAIGTANDSVVDYTLFQTLETLCLEADDMDHPPGFSHFNHVRHQSSSSAWPTPSFLSSNRELDSSRSQQEGGLPRSNNIWSNGPFSVNNDVFSASTSYPVIPSATSISSSSSGSVNRCGIIGEERRRTSPSNSTSTPPGNGNGGGADN